MTRTVAEKKLKAVDGAGRKPGRPSASDTSSDLRLSLINAALELFGAKGFDGASLSQIAGRAGADVALTRYYFGSKEDLWKAAVDHLAGELAGEIVNVLEIGSVSRSDQLKAVIRWFVDMSARHPYLSRIIVLDGDKEDVRGKHIAAHLIGPFYELLSALIAGAKEEGQVPDVAVRTVFFMITHGGSFPMAMPALTNAFPGGDITSKRALKAHADAIIALVMNNRED